MAQPARRGRAGGMPVARNASPSGVPSRTRYRSTARTAPQPRMARRKAARAAAAGVRPKRAAPSGLILSDADEGAFIAAGTGRLFGLQLQSRAAPGAGARLHAGVALR